ncbi:MAG: 3-deoxy-manno-octulosonate cytidylyltransferase [Phycisphaeraceae bacterium]|nr:3-deoxy-manno-octulosonate cytidylyltransferase [Phycisphaeraceae bacterium]
MAQGPAGSSSSVGGAVAIIPARMGSVRFPGKVLADATGKPLIQHVYEAARTARSVERAVVATDDARVLAAVRGFGGETVMTGEHPNGTSRLAEAAAAMGLEPDRVIVNVQGDEPEIEPQLIDLSVQALVETGADAATAACPFEPDERHDDPNVVKVVLDGRGMALYFSRAPIPHRRDADDAPCARPLRHVGLYVYRRAFLEEYLRLPATPLEMTEKLEQLRILEHGRRIAVAVAAGSSRGIDTPEQYAAFVERWRARGRGRAE